VYDKLKAKQYPDTGVKYQVEDDSLVVLNHVCQFYRPQAWADANPENRMEIAREEVKIKADLLLYIDNSNIEYLSKRQDDISNMTLKPRNVFYINNSDRTIYTKDRCVGCKTTLCNIVNPEIKNVWSAADCAMPKSQYFCIFDALDKISPTYLEDIDRRLNDDLEKFVMLTPAYGWSGTIIQRRMYELLGKNHEKPIVDKIRKACEEYPYLMGTI